MKQCVKKISAFLIAVAMVFNIGIIAFGGSVYADLEDDSIYSESIYRLSMFGVLNGYADGSIRAENFVTRAEFSKMIVTAVGQADKVVANNAAGVFSDVSKEHWANGYINFVNKSGYILGYPDGSFKPDNNITYGEVLTIIVRVLGYTTEDVGYHWPSNFIEKAAALELTTGLAVSADSYVNRGSLAVIIDRALSTETNSQSGIKLLEAAGYKELEDEIIVATSKEDQSLTSEQIKTGSGTYKLANTMVKTEVEKCGNIYLDKNSKVIAFYPKVQATRTMVVESVINKTISGYDGNQPVTLSTNNKLTVYWEGAKYSLIQLVEMNKIKDGTILKLYGDVYDEWNYAFMQEDDLIGPVTLRETPSSGATNLSGIPVDSSARVFKNGLAVKITELSEYDIVYYSPATKTITAYDERRTGVYEEAFPSKAYVTSISLSGETYKIETKTAIAKLDETPGSFKINDKITILLGKDGEVADVISSSGLALDNYGIILDTYTQVSTEEDTKGQRQYVTKLFKPDGRTYEYKSYKDYESYIGDMVYIDFEDGLMVVKRQCKNSNLTGTVNKVQKTIGDYQLSEDIVIIEKLFETEDVLSVRLVDWSEIDKPEFTTGTVINFETDNKFGDIVLLYMNNFSNEGYTYGVLKNNGNLPAKPNGPTKNTYELNLNGTDGTYTADGSFNTKEGPVGVYASGNKIISMFSLVTAGYGYSIDAMDDIRIKVDGKIYRMSENVVIYSQTITENAIPISKEDLLAMDFQRITLFADKAMDKGGKIRVIVAKSK